MESNYLPKSHFNHINFNEEERDLKNGFTPHDLPDPLKLGLLPPEVLKSSTVESLIHQNEDLMARLKVSLRRMSQLENQNLKLNQQLTDLQTTLQSQEDLKMIFKEKESLFKNKLNNIENQLQLNLTELHEKNQTIKTYENEILRYRKYHERIRTQVKPHIIELKSYAKNLEDSQAQLITELDSKNTELNELREKINLTLKQSRQAIEEHELQNHKMVDSYEATLFALREEITQLKKINEDNAHISDLNKSLQKRCVELENMLIEEQRTKNLLKEDLTSSLQRKTEENDRLIRELSVARTENEDFKLKLIECDQSLKDLQHSRSQNLGQLESLRYLYKQKSDECEKVKLALSSLEKLNVDLSEKLQSYLEMKT